MTDPSGADAFRLSPQACRTLLLLARESIETRLGISERAPGAKWSGMPLMVSLSNHELTRNEELRQPAAVFVTLMKNGRLRGCIGHTEPQGPLHDAVREMAIAAAFQDPRFPAVTRDEMDDLHIEISVLSPLRRIATAAEIRPHEHGVSVQSGMRRGLFLPQVWESLPLKEDFLSELCSQKAGLPRDAWRHGEVELWVFTVFAFEE